MPYTGQEYDTGIYELIEKGWDHEHCWICNASIEEGKILTGQVATQKDMNYVRNVITGT
jgi:hypothetical protein